MSAYNQGPMSESTIPDDRQERYNLWKKNTRLLYDYLNTNTNKWPSLTCQFFPDLDTDTDTHKILLSSFTSSQLPQDESVYIAKLSTAKHLNWSSLNNFDADELEFKPDNSTKFPPKNLVTSLTIKFPSGECNRARYVPQNPDIIGAASSDGSVYIFDRTKHGIHRMRQSSDEQLPYESRLYHETSVIDESDCPNEVLSISWNPQNEGLIACSYTDGYVRVWDMKKYKHSNPIISTVSMEAGLDSSGVNDVCWMPLHDSIFAAAGESSILAIYDTRKKDNAEVFRINEGVHHSGINCCKFNYSNSMLLASGDSEGAIRFWDIRKLNSGPIMSLEHGSSVSTLEWNPNVDTILATAGQDDGLVKLWDISKGELLFVHGGHMLGVNDISWNHHDPWLMCSVSNDNSIHIWRPAKHLVEAE